MVPMTVCRERVDWYGVGFWGERVADPFLCGPVASYSTLYRGGVPISNIMISLINANAITDFPPTGSPFYRYYSLQLVRFHYYCLCMDANMMKGLHPHANLRTMVGTSGDFSLGLMLTYPPDHFLHFC